jgi:DNA-nicking Smr family endonuclease
MRPPRRRSLSREEAYLWGEIAKLITPLRARARPKKPAPEAGPDAVTPVTPALANPSLATSAAAKSTPAKSASAKPASAKPATPKPSFPKPDPAKPDPAAAVPPTVRPAAKATPPAAKRPVKLGDLAGLPAGRPAAARPPAAAPPPGLERKERRGLERGTLTIEARIDLHGLYQAEAHAALVGFLMRARAAGHARVLVVTGKGGEAFSDAGFS